MKAVDVVLGLITREGRWFLQRRDPGNTVLPGYWEFPGGKTQVPESLAEALRRELREEVDWEQVSATPLDVIEHGYAEGLVRLHPFLCEGQREPRTSLAWGWFTLEEMRRLKIPDANAGILELLR